MACKSIPLTLLAVLPALVMLNACDEEGGDDFDEQALVEDDDAALEEGEDDEQQDDEEESEDEPDQDSEEPEEDPEPEPEPEPEPAPAEAIPCDFDQAWEGYECTTDEGEEGLQQCLLIDGEEFYTPCTTEDFGCVPGDGYDMGCLGEICTWDGSEFSTHYWEEDDCNTPLVLNFEGGPVEFGPVAAATFDLSTDGTCTNTAWPTSPWLAMDRDGDGFIRSGAELFGNATAMQSGGAASHGFMALAELDSNLDGKITAEDERFSELVLWSDFDEDRIGAYAELKPLSETTLVSIDLGFERKAQCDAMGNCGYERASFEYRRDDTIAYGEVVDVRLACQ